MLEIRRWEWDIEEEMEPCGTWDLNRALKVGQELGGRVLKPGQGSLGHPEVSAVRLGRRVRSRLRWWGERLCRWVLRGETEVTGGHSPREWGAIRGCVCVKFYIIIIIIFCYYSVMFSKSTELCKHNHGPILKYFHHPKRFLGSLWFLILL